VNWDTLECVYPNYPDVEHLKVLESDRAAWLDLRPYIDNTTYTVNEHASILRTYRMFRTLGLRHLCVIDRHNHLLGVITRADLASIHSDESPLSHARAGRDTASRDSDESPLSHARAKKVEFLSLRSEYPKPRDDYLSAHNRDE
jgi:CBS-domain-containing membrane protein